MTLEEMKAVAGAVVAALNAAGSFIGAEIVESDIVPGEPIPIMFEKDGDVFALALDIA